MTLTAALRAIGPSLCGSIFAWSIAELRPFPLDTHLVFFFLMLLFFGTSWLASLLPETINKQKE